MGSVNITSLAKSIIKRYDYNRNGAIDLKNPTKGDETTRQEVQQTPQAIDYLTWDHSKLFKAADADGDGSVTQAELEATLKTFDADGDGSLKSKTWFWDPSSEYEAYEAEYGEELIGDVHVPTPQPPAPPPIPVPHV